MSEHKTGVFLCQGGSSKEESAEFRQLKWWAEAGFPRGMVFEISQACQKPGVENIARLCAQNGIDNLVLGACANSQGKAAISRELWAQGLKLQQFKELDVCQKPEGRPAACEVAPLAGRALQLAAAELEVQAELQCGAVTVVNRVLVIGAGLAAMQSALGLSRAGHEVALMTPGTRLSISEPLLGPDVWEKSQALEERISNDPVIELIPGGKLLSLAGPAGRFSAVIMDQEGNRRKLETGAVLLVRGPAQTLNLDLDEDPRVISIDSLLGLLAAPEHFKKRFAGQSLRVGLSVGLGGQAWPAYLAAACGAALQLMEEHGAKVSIFTNYAKVAQPKLEKLTQTVRDEGAVLIKFSEKVPSFSLAEDVVRASYIDEIAEVELSQDLDLLAVDSKPAPDRAWVTLLARLGLGLNPQGYAGDDRPGLPVGSTAHSGVFALGAACGPASLAELESQIGATLGSIHELLALAPQNAPLKQVMVDRRKCALCLTCVRVCPSGAMGRNERRPEPNPLTCTVCGTCAAECPMDAIQLVNLEDARMDRMIEAGLKDSDMWPSPPADPEILVLACANSAMRSMQKARMEGLPMPPGLRIVEVPCAGKIDPEMVLRAFRAGYDLVQVISCHPEACYSVDGNTWAGYRETHLRSLLDEAGLDNQRLVWSSAAPNMARAAHDVLSNAAALAGELGPNPLKGAARARDLLSKFTLKMDDTFTLVP